MVKVEEDPIIPLISMWVAMCGLRSSIGVLTKIKLMIQNIRLCQSLEVTMTNSTLLASILPMSTVMPTMRSAILTVAALAQWQALRWRVSVRMMVLTIQVTSLGKCRMPTSRNSSQVASMPPNPSPATSAPL